MHKRNKEYSFTTCCCISNIRKTVELLQYKAARTVTGSRFSDFSGYVLVISESRFRDYALKVSIIGAIVYDHDAKFQS